MKKKTVVLGLDGATWKLLKPYMEKGYMPTLKRIVEGGVSGRLESTLPAMTAPAWVTFATGKHPGKHGVFDFMLPTDSLGNMKFATSRDIQSKTVYELLHENSVKPILVNLPGTFPPKLDGEITITSLLTQGDEWIFPASLKDEFPGFAKYRLTPDESIRFKERTQEYIDDLLLHLEEQMTCVKWLFENKPWDFFFYLFSHTDWVSHLMYTDLEEKDDASGRRIFEQIDEHLKWFVDHLPADTNLIMISDHGFKAYKKIFYFNRWLEKEGYLVTNTNATQFRAAATRRAKEKDKIRAGKKKIQLGSGVFKVISAVPALDRFARWTYNKVIKRYLPIDLNVNVGVDYAKTRVCFPKGSYITNAYINKDWVYTDGIVSREEYAALRAEVVEKMRNIKDPDGKPVVARVFTRDEVYGDDAPGQAPDIFFELSDYWLVGQFQSGKLFDNSIENKHDQWGIFIANGPDFQQGAEAADLKIQDITPLILHLNGLPVPEDCDGVVPTQIFNASSESGQREVKRGQISQKRLEKFDLKRALSQIKF